VFGGPNDQMRISQPSWSIEISDWQVSYPAECVTVVPESNDSAFQLSCGVNASGTPATEVDIRPNAEGAARMYRQDLATVVCGEFAGLTLEHVEGAHFWRRWWLYGGRAYLFVTYNCAPEVRDRDRAIVDGMLASLRLERPPNKRMQLPRSAKAGRRGPRS